MYACDDVVIVVKSNMVVMTVVGGSNDNKRKRDVFDCGGVLEAFFCCLLEFQKLRMPFSPQPLLFGRPGQLP